MADRITAVFDSEEHAEMAVRDLRDLGISDDRLSIVARHREGRGGGAVAEETREGEDMGSGAGRGAATGAGIGALFGLAAALIPGIGPFITAGFLAELLGATAGGIASGAIVGGTAGAVAGALARAGYSEDEARYYGDAVERGGVMVAVDMEGSNFSHAQVRRVLADHGGRFHGEESARRAA